jgi:hypothetical protein
VGYPTQCAFDLEYRYSCMRFVAFMARDIGESDKYPNFESSALR